jgi:hypothetical protein
VNIRAALLRTEFEERIDTCHGQFLMAALSGRSSADV